MGRRARASRPVLRVNDHETHEIKGTTDVTLKRLLELSRTANGARVELPDGTSSFVPKEEVRKFWKQKAEERIELLRERGSI